MLTVLISVSLQLKTQSTVTLWSCAPCLCKFLSIIMSFLFEYRYLRFQDDLVWGTFLLMAGMFVSQIKKITSRQSQLTHIFQWANQRQASCRQALEKCKPSVNQSESQVSIRKQSIQLEKKLFSGVCFGGKVKHLADYQTEVRAETFPPTTG